MIMQMQIDIHKKSKVVTLIILLILSIAALISYSSVSPQENVVWVWDGASPPTSAKYIALVVDHLLLKDTSLLHRGRKTTPQLKANVQITPVVHVEVDLINPPSVPDQYKEEIVSAVLSAAEVSTSGWVQLDYEAPPSHKALYKSVVKEIKRELPTNIKLSVTTLAWWCSADKWLNDLGADEIVPMFFRMGKDTDKIRQILTESPQSLSPACQNKSAGFAIQEAPSQIMLKRYHRIYWFDYDGWKGKETWTPV